MKIQFCEFEKAIDKVEEQEYQNNYNHEADGDEFFVCCFVEDFVLGKGAFDIDCCYNCKEGGEHV